MAFAWSVNNTPANGGAAMFLFKTLMKAQGYTVPSSSDGTTYNSSGDQITTNTSGAGGIQNAQAWFILKHPTIPGKQWCYQNNATPGTSAANWRIKHSYLAGFSGGTPGATRVPSAADEVIMIGGGTDAAPTFAAIFGADGGYRFNCGCDSTTGSFFSFAFPTGGGPSTHGMFMDPVVPLNVADTDPYVTGCAQSNGFQMTGGMSAGSTWGSYGGVVTGAPPALSAVAEQTTFVTNPFDSKDVAQFIRFYKSSANFKGRLTNYFYDTVAHTTPTLETFVTTNDTVIVGAWAIPWSGVAITI